MIFFIIIYSLLIGSFLNVCIYRIPLGKSIAFPPSHCPKCETRLKSIDLVPILSYLFNKGKCRYCGEKIAIQYPLIEGLNALLYIVFFIKVGFNILFIKYCILASLLIVITFIDLKHQIIPDSLNIFGIIVGIIFISNFKEDIIGLLLGFSIFLFIAIISKGAMGGGDIKLMAVLGLNLGYKYIIIVTILSFVIGAIISLVLLLVKIKSRKDYIPFGPFISIAAFITMLFGNEIIQWYISKYFIN